MAWSKHFSKVVSARLRRITKVFQGKKRNWVGATFEDRVWIDEDVRITNSSIGKYTFVRYGSEINHSVIGSYGSIGPGTAIGVGAHPVKEQVSTHPIFFESRPWVGWDYLDETEEEFEFLSTTNVGSDVWFGQRAIVKTGITIGHGAVIGAGSIVTKDVPPYAIVAGAPAKVLRMRFTESEIEKLLENPWWEKPESWIRENHKLFSSVKLYLSHL